MAIESKPRVVPPSQGPLSSRCVRSQMKANPKASAEKSNNSKKPNVLTKNNMVSLSTTNKSPVSLLAGPRILAGPPGPNVDERLRLARERREEKEKLLACRELSRLEREQRARRYYEEQLEERKKKLLDQRVKEEGRRAAVEEKRKQRLKEEKERYESAVRKTLEKSQRLQQNQNLRVGRPNKTSASCHSMNTTPKNNQPPHKPSQQTGPAGQNGPARQTGPAGQTGPARQTGPPAPSSKPRSISLPQIKAEKQHKVDKTCKTRLNAGTAPVNMTRTKPAPTKTNQPTSPSPQRTPRRPIRRQSSSLQPDLPSVPEEELPVCVAAPSSHAPHAPPPSGPTLSPGNTRPINLAAGRYRAADAMQRRPEPHPRSDASDESNSNRASSRTEPDRSAPQSPASPAGTKPPDAASKSATGGGTTNREEALRLLAERRKEARLQREREEQRERREEEERRSLEEEALRREERLRQQAEEQARLHVEAQRLVEEKRRREEEEHRRAEEERAQAMREAALLQKKREEEQQALEREKADLANREREVLAQREDAERQARKKRLEEIMRRTRRTDAGDTKSAPTRISPTEAQPKENTEPVNNGNTGPPTRQPAGLRPAPRGLAGLEDMVPVVAFKERRTIRTLTGLDEIQTHQRTEVI